MADRLTFFFVIPAFSYVDFSRFEGRSPVRAAGEQ